MALHKFGRLEKVQNGKERRDRQGERGKQKERGGNKDIILREISYALKFVQTVKARFIFKVFTIL